ncbi:MAG TPA: FAD:protein FMN transferase [Solirubrobacteraceae bacterium]|nr:FAD:protein FMN transferase [Solirubrobacteraceae bacterium]
MTAVAESAWEVFASKVVLRVTEPGALERARAAAERELNAIDRACSRFRDDSEITYVNANAGRAVPVSPLLMEALALGVRAAEITEGDVDPTIGAALVLAGYDRDWRQLAASAESAPPVLPESDTPPRGSDSRASAPAPGKPAVAGVRVMGGWRRVVLDRERGIVRLPAGAVLDLGATAKALAADRAAAAAAAAGACGALVAIGGDVAVQGPAPAGGWSIRVTDDHRSGPRAPGQTVTIVAGGLATSSTSVRRWSHAGRTRHHILDPATGEPARGPWRTVSAAAGSCADANIATTGAIVRGERALAWLRAVGLPARLVEADGRVHAVGDWPRPRLVASQPAQSRTRRSARAQLRATAPKPPESSPLRRAASARSEHAQSPPTAPPRTSSRRMASRAMAVQAMAAHAIAARASAAQAHEVLR